MTKNFVIQLFKVDAFIVAEFYRDSYSSFKFLIWQLAPLNICMWMDQVVEKGMGVEMNMTLPPVELESVASWLICESKETYSTTIWCII